MLDLKSKQVVARIPVLGKPAGIAMARDGRAAYVRRPPRVWNVFARDAVSFSRRRVKLDLAGVRPQATAAATRDPKLACGGTLKLGA